MTSRPSRLGWGQRAARSAVTSWALAAGWTDAAYAQRTWGTDAGEYLEYRFGAGLPGHLAFGVEVRQMYAQRRFDVMCGDTSLSRATHAGVAARLSIHGWDQVRLLVAPQAGLTTAGGFSPWTLGAELGFGFRLGAMHGGYVQPGLEGSLGNFFIRGDTAFGAETLRVTGGEGSIDLGGRIGERVTQQCFVVGRPLRRAGGLAPLPIAYHIARPRSGPVGGDSTESAPARAGRVWAARASTEWASVPAFRELAEQLAASGAPSELQARALAAAEEEIGHALSAAGVAATLAGAELVVEPPVLTPRPPATGRAGLLCLGTESWSDGCLGEGAAAATAAVEEGLTGYAGIRAVQRTVAADEARHAELGWDVLRWVLAHADQETTTAIRALVNRPSPAVSARTDGEPDDDCAIGAFGCLSEPMRAALVRHHRKAAARRFEGE